MNLTFADGEYTPPTVVTTYDTGPSPTELFFQDPANLFLVGIFAILAIGLVVYLRNKAA